MPTSRPDTAYQGPTGPPPDNPPAAAPATAAELPSAPDSVEVLGVPLARIDYAGTLAWIDAVVASRARGYVCVAAVHTVMQSQEDPDLRDAVLRSSLTVPDGQPLVWAMGKLGHPLPARVYGPELMDRACARAATTGQRFYLYGGRNQGTLVQLALNLRRRHPGLRIVGGYAPPFRPLDDDERDAIVADIDRSRADVVWVGIGVPKQEKWMAAMRPLLRAPVLVGVGAAFDFHAGRIPQAPSWMQEVGLEWVFRLAREPRRLWRRYARYNPWFLAAFARQLAAHKRLAR